MVAPALRFAVAGATQVLFAGLRSRPANAGSSGGGELSRAAGGGASLLDEP
jgi:hypothetical protein